VKVDYKVSKCPKCGDEVIWCVSWGGHFLITPMCSCGGGMQSLEEYVVPDNCVVIWGEHEEVG